MDWKQIETNWALMARRIRADAQCGVTDDGVVLQRRRVKGEAPKGAAAKKITAMSTESAQKRDPVSPR